MKTTLLVVGLLLGSAAGGYLLYNTLFANERNANPLAAGPRSAEAQTATVGSDAPAASDATVTRLPVFSLPDLDGVDRSITEWDGQPLLINFWATWCPPCRKEIPLLIELQDEFSARGLQVIGIAVDDVAPVRRFAGEIGIDYPLLIGEQAALDVADAFGISVIGLPITVFTRRDGSILAVHQGELHRDEAESILNSL